MAECLEIVYNNKNNKITLDESETKRVLAGVPSLQIDDVTSMRVISNNLVTFFNEVLSDVDNTHYNNVNAILQDFQRNGNIQLIKPTFGKNSTIGQLVINSEVPTSEYSYEDFRNFSLNSPGLITKGLPGYKILTDLLNKSEKIQTDSPLKVMLVKGRIDANRNNKDMVVSLSEDAENLGMFSEIDNTIFVAANDINATTFNLGADGLNTLNHELIHYLSNNITEDYKNRLNTIYDRFKQTAAYKSGKYSYLHNAGEFLAYSLTERDLLSNINDAVIFDDIINLAVDYFEIKPENIRSFLDKLATDDAKDITESTEDLGKLKEIDDFIRKYDIKGLGIWKESVQVPKNEISSVIKEKLKKDGYSFYYEDEIVIITLGDILPFRRSNTPEALEKIEPLKTTKKNIEEVAKALWDNFKSSIPTYEKGETKVRQYDVTFGPYQKYENNKAKVFRLKQGDIIQYKLEEKDSSGKWSIPTDFKTTYAPIIYTHVGTDGNLYLALATSWGIKYIGENELVGFRENFGTWKDGEEKVKQTELRKAYDYLKSVKYLDEDGNVNTDTLFRKFKVNYKDDEGNAKSFDKFISDDNSTIYVSFNHDNPNAELSYDDYHFSNLSQNDIVVGSYIDENEKVRYYNSPVIRVLGNVVETVFKDKNGVLRSKYMPKQFITGALLIGDKNDDGSSRGNVYSKALEKLQEIDSAGSINRIDGFYRESFINYDFKGEIMPDKPNWNDLYFIHENIKNLGGTLSKYSEWRKNTLESDVNKEITLDSLESDLEKEYFKYFLASKRRDYLTSKIGFGSIVQLDRPEMRNVNGNWVATGKTKHVYGMVVSKNGKSLNVLLYKPTWTEAGTKVEGEGDVYLAKVNINSFRAWSEEKTSAAGKKYNKPHYAIRAVYYDNTQHVAIIDYFKNLKDSFNDNYVDKMKFFERLKKGESIPRELEKFNLKNVITNTKGDETSLIMNEDTAVKLSDRYELDFFGDITLDAKYKKLATVQPGSVLLLASDNDNYQYTSNIVVDIDERTGMPIVGFLNPKNKKYTIISPSIENIVGIGYDLQGIELEVDGKTFTYAPDPFRVKKRQQYIDAFKKHKTRKVFDTKSEAEAYVKKEHSRIKEDYIVYTKLYEDRDGKRSLTQTKGSKVLYVPQFKKKSGYLEDINDSDYWRTIWGISDISTKKLWDYIKEGDIVQRMYNKGKGEKQDNRYPEFVIIHKDDNKMIGRTFYRNYNDDVESWDYRDQFFFNNTDKGLGQGGYSIKLYNKNHGYEQSKKDITALKSGKDVEGKKQGTYERKPTTVKKKNEEKPSNTKSVSNLTTTKARTAAEFLGVPQSKLADFKSSPADLSKLKLLGQRLEDIYGKEITFMTSEQIMLAYKNSPFRSHSRAFIDEDNNIIINSDYASLAEPVHELGHLILDGLRKTDVGFYNSLMDKIKDHSDYNKVANLYPELSEKELSEEVFVTVLGEFYNTNYDQTTPATANFVNQNQGLFSKFIEKVKNWFRNLFGIDSYRFNNVTDEQLLNLSISEILDKFTNDMMDGKFTKEVDLSKIKREATLNGTYLKTRIKDESGEILEIRESKVYQDLVLSGLSANEASKIWLSTKTPNFRKWHGNTILTDNFGEAKIFYRTGAKTFSETKTPNSDIVVIKGPTFDNRVVNENQFKSIYALGHIIEKETDLLDVDAKAHDMGLPMIGTVNDLNKTVNKLEKIYLDFTFKVEPAGRSNFITYYRKPSTKAIELKNKLLKSNNIVQLC